MEFIKKSLRELCRSDGFVMKCLSWDSLH